MIQNTDSSKRGFFQSQEDADSGTMGGEPVVVAILLFCVCGSRSCRSRKSHSLVKIHPKLVTFVCVSVQGLGQSLV